MKSVHATQITQLDIKMVLNLKFRSVLRIRRIRAKICKIQFLKTMQFDGESILQRAYQLSQTHSIISNFLPITPSRSSNFRCSCSHARVVFNFPYFFMKDPAPYSPRERDMPLARHNAHLTQMELSRIRLIMTAFSVANKCPIPNDAL